MELTEKERKILKLAKWLPANGESNKKVDVDEVALAAYLEGRLGESDAQRFAHALADHPEWLDAAVTYAAMRGQPSEGWKEPTAEALRRAVDLFPRKRADRSRPFMDLVVSFAAGAVKILQETADSFRYYAPAYASVRTGEAGGEPLEARAHLAWFSKQMGPFTAEVEVERIDAGRGEVTIRARQGSGAPVAGVRVSLFDERREIESMMVSGGEAVFSDLPPGRYLFELTQNSEPLGQIALQVRGEPQ